MSGGLAALKRLKNVIPQLQLCNVYSCLGIASVPDIDDFVRELLPIVALIGIVDDLYCCNGKLL